MDTLTHHVRAKPQCAASVCRDGAAGVVATGVVARDSDALESKVAASRAASCSLSKVEESKVAAAPTRKQTLAQEPVPESGISSSLVSSSFTFFLNPDCSSRLSAPRGVQDFPATGPTLSYAILFRLLRISQNLGIFLDRLGYAMKTASRRPPTAARQDPILQAVLGGEWTQPNGSCHGHATRADHRSVTVVGTGEDKVALMRTRHHCRYTGPSNASS